MSHPGGPTTLIHLTLQKPEISTSSNGLLRLEKGLILENFVVESVCYLPPCLLGTLCKSTNRQQWDALVVIQNSQTPYFEHLLELWWSSSLQIHYCTSNNFHSSVVIIVLSSSASYINHDPLVLLFENNCYISQFCVTCLFGINTLCHTCRSQTVSFLVIITIIIFIIMITVLFLLL